MEVCQAYYRLGGEEMHKTSALDAHPSPKTSSLQFWITEHIENMNFPYLASAFCRFPFII